MSNTDKSTLVALVENKPGVLNRVVSLFRRRNFNMDSLTVGRTSRPDVSRMTIVMDTPNPGDAKKIIMNLYKMVDVIEVLDMSNIPNVTRDIALIKISATTANTRNTLTELTYAYGARIVDIGPDVAIIEISGEPEQVEKFIEEMRPFEISEIVRSGAVTMGRGIRTLKEAHYESKRALRSANGSNLG